MKNSSYIIILTSIVVVFTALVMLGVNFFSDPCAGQCSLPQYIEKDETSNSIANYTLEPKNFDLDNGIKLTVLSTPFDDENEVLTRIIFLRGYADEAPEKRGAAQLSIDMAWESGVGGKNSDQISAMLYEEGIEINSRVYPFITKIDASFPKDKMARFIDLCDRFLQEAHVSKNGAAIVKSRYQQTVEERLHNLGHNYDDFIKGVYFPGMPQLQSISLDDVRKIRHEDADDFIHQITAEPSKFVVMVVGNVDPESVFKEFNATLGHFKPKTGRKESIFDANVFKVSETKEPKKFTLQQGGKGETLTSVTFPIRIEIDSKNVFGIEFLANLIEERLRDRIKESMGSSFGIDVSYEFPLYPYLKPSLLSIQFRSLPKDTSAILEIIQGCLKDLKDNGPTDRDIQAVHEYVLQSDEFWRRSDQYWLDVLSNYAMWNWPFEALFSEKQPLLNFSKADVEEIISTAFQLNESTTVIGLH